MTPTDDQAGEPRRISVPANITVSALTLLGWMGLLEMAAAAESDAGRPAMSKQMTELRNAIGNLFPPELRLNEVEK